MCCDFEDYYDDPMVDYSNDEYVMPENRLWFAKVLLNFKDLQKIIQKGRGVKRRKKMEKWFLEDSYDFIFTCEAALLNPRRVKEAAEGVIEENRLKMKAMGISDD